MEMPFRPAALLDQLLREVASDRLDDGPAFDPILRPADPRHGDFQANGALAFAKARKRNPREVAQTLVDGLAATPLFQEGNVAVSIAGPGFLNFTIQPAWQMRWLQTYRTDEDLQMGAAELRAGSRVVIDYSSPNTAKQMHVGHIRSTVIGEALSRLLRFTGAEVVSDNHLGDWGTQFGIILMAVKEAGYDLDHPGDDPLAEIEQLYKEGAARFKDSDEAKETARRELVALQQGDPESVRIWERVNELSYTAFQEVYDRLGVRFDAVLGESFYRDKVAEIYEEMTATGLATESEGALVVFHPDHPRFAEQPFIIRKSDGASNYATTDLATVLYRHNHYKSDEIIYVTDSRQQDHFAQLFLTVEAWFNRKGYKVPALRHVTFGTILGEDGKAIKTRSGESVKLKDLLNEAVERAQAIVNEKNPDLPEAERRQVAEVIGVNAVRYADLAQNRSSDYVFAWDKLLSFDGNTAPYLLYAVARIHSIFRKADLKPGEAETGASAFETPEECALARQLLLFPSALEQCLTELRPHFLCGYLYDLSGYFSSFYNANRVIVEEEPVKARRLLLCARTLQFLESGLRALGIPTLQRM